MKFGRLKGNGLLINSHRFVTKCALILANSFIWPLKTVILPFLVIFNFIIIFTFKVITRLRLFWDDL